MATSPAAVTAVLRAAGFETGVRYTQFGYKTRDGNPLGAGTVGVMTTRRRGVRYGGVEDRGHVAVFLVNTRGVATDADHDRARAALVAAGFTVAGRGCTIEVTDAARVSS